MLYFKKYNFPKLIQIQKSNVFCFEQKNEWEQSQVAKAIL